MSGSVLLASVSVSTDTASWSSVGSCLLRSNKTAEEVGLKIARGISVFGAVEEEFVGALVGTQMMQHLTCQRTCSKKMAECLLKFYVNYTTFISNGSTVIVESEKGRALLEVDLDGVEL